MYFILLGCAHLLTFAVALQIHINASGLMSYLERTRWTKN